MYCFLVIKVIRTVSNQLKRCVFKTCWIFLQKNEKKDEIKCEDKKSNLTLPSSVFASELEVETGMLNKAAPRKGKKTR